MTQLALISADEAIKDARLTQEDIVEGTILVGNAFGGTTSLLSNYKKALSGEPLSPFLITNFLSNTIGANIAIKYHVHGNNQAINTACASGTDAIGQGYERIMSGQYRIAIVGGSEASLTPLIINGFDKIGALSHSDDPSTASRPFDQERDGFVMGEGAGFLILENLENALERNAHILAEIVGYETNNDASNLLAPEPSAERISQMLNNLLVKAKIDKRSIDYVNTHGTSTKLNDSTEIKGLTRVFKGKKIVLSSTKSYIGHALGASGAIEAIVTAKSLEHSIVHGIKNLRNPEIGGDFTYLADTLLKVKLKYAISESFGFGGHNSALLLKKYEG